MATATQAQTESPAVETTPATKDLWRGQQIEVIVGTGEFGSGKTIFGCTIDPGPQTLVLDDEGSSAAYQSSLGFERMDMAENLRAKYGADFTSQQRYEWWRETSIAKGKSGKYSVLMVDPFSDIESGLTSMVEKNPARYGYTANQFRNASGLKWAAVKDQLKADLDLLRTYFSTVYLVVHMRNQYRGNSPTGKREAKGKDTLYQLASLFLKFERDVDKKGSRPDIPSAEVVKSRLAIPNRKDGQLVLDEYGDVQLVPVLPPHLPKATPGAIRHYIDNPPDYKKLKAGERVVEHAMTEDERLNLQQSIAATELQKMEAELALEQQRARAAEAASAMKAAQPPSSDQSAKVAAEKAEKAETAAQPVTASQIDSIRKACEKANPDKQWLAEQLKGFGVNKMSELTTSAADGLLSALYGLDFTKSKAASDKKLAESGTEPDPNCESPHVPCTEEQKAVIRDLLPKAKIMPEKFREVLEGFGVGSVAALSEAHSDQIIASLKKKIEGGEPTPAEEPPSKPAASTSGEITTDQQAELKRLIGATGWERDKQARFLSDRGLNSFRSLTTGQAAELIDRLKKVEEASEAGSQEGK